MSKGVRILFFLLIFLVFALRIIYSQENNEIWPNSTVAFNYDLEEGKRNQTQDDIMNEPKEKPMNEDKKNMTNKSQINGVQLNESKADDNAVEATNGQMNMAVERGAYFHRDMVAVFMQSDGRANTETYVDTGFSTFPNITRYTICLRFRLLHGGAPVTLFSYTDGKSFEDMNIAVKYPEEDLLLICCYYHLHHYIDVPVQLFKWHHLCISVDLRADFLKVVFDGLIFEKTAGRPESMVDRKTVAIKGGGRIVLGQNVHSEAKWDITQALHGEIADLYFYNETVNFKDLIKYVNCQDYNVTQKPLYRFDKNMTGLALMGNSKVISVKLNDTCIQRKGHLTIFTERVPFDQSYARCRKFSGKMAVPRDDEENSYVHNTFIVFNDQCTQGWVALYWLGLVGNISEQLWTNKADGTVVRYGNWLQSWEYPTEVYPCAVSGATGIDAMWYNAKCDTLTCSICNFTSVPVLRIRGLCRESKFDRVYYVFGYQNYRPVFEGMFLSRIYWNGDTWELEVRTVEEDAVAQMVEKKPKGYPIGLASWHTTADGCGEKTPQYLLTLCNEDSFTCSDGSCIKIDKRCDEQVDCLDNSDELSCEIIHVPLGYSVDLPPPSLDASSLNLMIDLDITSVRKFDLVGFMVHIDVIQRLTWRDARITYSNLKAGYFNNRAMATGEVWRPHVRIQDGTFSPTNVITRSEIFQVNREAPPLEDDDTRTGEDRLYDGAEHRIRIEEIYTVEFMCQFGLLMYPFDIQTCVFYMNITNIQDFILANGGANFTGERASLEYQLLDQQMLSLEGSRAVKVILRFKNRYGYYIGNAIIPSILMVTICYLTFYFDLHDFEDRIMVSLTSLLVLASLFAQTSQSIPKTAYLKLIDVWYIAVIFLDFVIVVFLVIIENCRLRGITQPNNRVFHISPKGPNSNPTKEHVNRQYDVDNCSLARKVNFMAMVGFPTINIIFFMAFFMVGFLKFYVQ